MKAKAINKLKEGETYYLPSGTWNYKKVTFIRIIDEKHVLVCDKKDRIFSCHISKLQKVPYKAVKGYKARERVKQQMNDQKQKEQESLVDKNIQNKIKKLGHSAYATIEKNKYIVKGYEQTAAFNALEELDNWANLELAKYEATKDRILEKEYKHLCVTCKDGHKEYYTIINISFSKFEIFCKHFRGNIEDINEDKLLKREDVNGLKLKIHR